MSEKYTNIYDVARGRWRSILISAGISPSLLNKRHQPCPFCGGKDRFRWTDFDSSGCFICNQCGSGNGMALLMGLLGIEFKEAADMILNTEGLPRVEEEQRNKEKEIAAMKGTWGEALAISSGDAVDKYLSCRNISFRPTASVVRSHGGLFHYQGTFPAMVSLVVSPNGKAVNIHRTFLDGNGGKAPVDQAKLVMKGEVPPGSYIPLMPHEETLGVAEGIETALRASAIFGVPVWACINAKNMESFVPPEDVSSLIIFGDNDANHYQGQLSAYTLAHKAYTKRKRDGSELDVRVCIPEKEGADWADY